MSRPKNRNSLLTGNGFAANTPASSKEHISSMKYVMKRPEEPVFALSDETAAQTYPDYSPWAEKDAKNSKLTAAETLNNGYFESPSVANEYFSARNLIQETLFSAETNGKSLLLELSSNLAKAYRARNDVINKVSNASHGFKLPPRVTLTASKREMWLRDLANPEIPLSAVASKIPHGIRNKVLVDHLCSLKVPSSRALWFVKCVLCSEQQLLRKKFHSRQNSGQNQASGAQSSFPSLDSLEGRWIQEWTSQVADYVLKFSREMPGVASAEKKTAYQAKYSYLLRLINTLYIENLVDRTFFLSCVSWFLRDGLPFQTDQFPDLLEISKVENDEDSPMLVRVLSENPLNYGQVLTALTLIQTFWTEYLNRDFLCKQLGEALLLNYFLVEKIPVNAPLSPDQKTCPCAVPPGLKNSILELISSLIVSLFRHNPNAFVVPDFWLLLGGVLYRILAHSSVCQSEKHRQNFEAIFRLINFRNESLMLNMRYMIKGGSKESNSESILQPSRFSGCANDDVFLFIDMLDSMNLKTGLAASLRPNSSTLPNDNKWRIHVKILVKWFTSAYRDMGPSVEKVLIICNYIKKKVLQPITSRGSAQLKAEFEGEILESIFRLAHEPHTTLSMHHLYVLFNELLQLKVISISSYLRKIIACGIFYISSQSESINDAESDPQVRFHLALLSNLPALNNKQHFQILSNWTPRGAEIATSFERALEKAKSSVLESLVADKFPEKYKEFLEETRTLTVGVKFLLAGTLTTQMKATVTSSPKLIHMSPSTVAKIYKFYEATDNLTVFFRVFVRFVLKNEDKVIIYYLDTLHFIGLLLQQNFLLVNFLPGSIDKVSAVYELYNLIISAYHDLASREPDVYNFRPLWAFMNSSVDRKISEKAGVPAKKHDPDLDRYLFSKDSVESPLKVQVPAPRRNQAYSADSFMENLNVLISQSPPEPSLEDVSDICAELGEEHSITAEGIVEKDCSRSRREEILLTWGTKDLLTERQDNAFAKIARMTIPEGKDINKPRLMARAIFASESAHVTLPLLMKVICYGLLSFSDVLAGVKSLENGVDRTLCSLLVFGEDITNELYTSQAVAFKLFQSEFRRDYAEETFHLALQEVSCIGSSEWTLIGKTCRQVVMHMLVHHRAYAMHRICMQIPGDKVTRVCAEMLNISELGIGSLSVSALAPVANEYSLPVLQLLFRVTTAQNMHTLDALGDSVLHFLDACEFFVQTNNSYFGELFNYLEWEQKSKVFMFLETYFLTYKEPLPLWGEDTSSEENQLFTFARTSQKGVDLLPVFKDFFRSFSMSSSESLDINVEQFQNFSNFLVNILQLVNNQEVLQRHLQHLHDITSIFLRLVIIHSVSLTELIASHDSVHFVFLKNMMSLLDSTFLSSGQEKLKILLFDLLLQMKGSLTQALVARPPEDLITSPQTLGIGNSPQKYGSSVPSPLGPHLDNSAGGVSALSTMSSILDLPEPELNAHDFGDDNTSCILTLGRDELECDSEVALVRDPHLVMVSREAREQFTENPFKAVDQKFTKPFKMDSVGLIEDTTQGINNGCVSLSVFGAYTTKENPY